MRKKELGGAFMKKTLLILFTLCSALLMTGCKCYFKDSNGEFDSYQELALRNDYVHVGYFIWTGYTEKRVMMRKVKRNQKMSAIFRCGIPYYINGMLPSTVNGAVFSPLLYFECGGVNGIASSPILITGCMNGIGIAPLFAGNIIVNGVAIAPVNFHGGSFGGVFFGMVNCRGLWRDRGGIDSQRELPEAVCHLGVVNLDFCFGQYCQIGVFNSSNGAPHFQFGVINNAQKGDSGHFALQLGLLNHNPDGLLPWMPLFNFSLPKEDKIR